MLIKLRPHHLLCTQGYSGKGYSDDFIAKMNTVVKTLREEESALIQLVFFTDDLCESCPNMLGENLCVSQERVLGFDKKLVDAFGLEEKTYIYKEIIAEIDGKITAEQFDFICQDCEWKPISACKKNILEKKFC